MLKTNAETSIMFKTFTAILLQH